MKRIIISRLLVVICAVLSGASATAWKDQKKQAASTPDTIHRGIGCLVAQDWIKDDLRELGLRVGQTVNLRYQTGSIPGISPDTPDMTNVLIFSPSGKRAWLAFFRPQTDGTITAIRNGYRVRHMNGGWDASEGNGGIATYNALSAYI